MLSYGNVVSNSGQGHHSDEELLDSLVPFYHSRILSFVNHTLQMGTREAEEYLEEITRTFQAEKYYLRDRWDSEAGNRLAGRMFG